MFQSIFRTKTRPRAQTSTNSPGSSISSKSPRSLPKTRIPSQRQRTPGFNPKLRIYTPTQARAVNQAAFCMPSCPVEDDLHSTGLYLRNGEFNHSLSFLFGANNPPPETWAAHTRLMMGEASEEDEELILSFLAHHPFQAGNVTDKIWWSSEEPAQLMMIGNPLSFFAPEVSSATFEPIKVAPIKPAG